MAILFFIWLAILIFLLQEKSMLFLIFITAICKTPSPLNGQNPLSVKKSICESSLNGDQVYQMCVETFYTQWELQLKMILQEISGIKKILKLLMLASWALKVAYFLDVPGLVAYKLVAYKKKRVLR